MPNWARSLSSMSPNASQGQMTAASAGEEPPVRGRHLHRLPRNYYLLISYCCDWYLPPRPSIPGTSSNLKRTESDVETLHLHYDPVLWSFPSRSLDSPLLSGFGSLALELPGLLLLELGRSGLGASGCCCCCVHFCEHIEWQRKKRETYWNMSKLSLWWALFGYFRLQSPSATVSILN